jgi:glycosyltransferase involved in cell wall biosynthesis
MDVIMETLRRLLIGSEPPLDAWRPASGSPVGRDRTKITAAVLARNDERTIARCISTLSPDAFDGILVLDTGSTDRTCEIVEQFDDGRIELHHVTWPDDFSAVRNLAMTRIGSGWVVFIDSDEWLPSASVRSLRQVLAEASGLAGIENAVLRPVIAEWDGGSSLPPGRMMLADGGVRFAGAVHEEPRLIEPYGVLPRWIGVNIEFKHDGYRPQTVKSRGKHERNARLIVKCRAIEPDNPRWIYFEIRDQLESLGESEIERLCAELAEVYAADANELAASYYSGALRLFCSRLADTGSYDKLRQVARELDRIEVGNCDSFYYRYTVRLAEAAAGIGRINAADLRKMLLETIDLRRRAGDTIEGALHTAGCHIDALVAALLDALGRPAEAEEYRRSMAAPWTDAFFVLNRPRWMDPEGGLLVGP